MEWLCIRLDMLSSITFVFSLMFLISIPPGIINPGLAGLAVTYGLNLNQIQAWVIWNICNLENKIISVERILQYTSIQSEPPFVLEEENRPDPSWPANGDVVPLDEESINHLQTTINQFTNEALRTLCLAYMELENEFSAEDTIPVTGFTCIGVVGIKDPVRPGVKESVALCRSGGITVRMVTGDNTKPAKKPVGNISIHTEPNMCELCIKCELMTKRLAK
ncbi:ABC transporter C family member 9-like [Lathyrus oleraceus]|uniref:ABC transporter C family member 9-like n=1 Tax=Pisum sativum TaxID=3888 RepID=UPI0021D3DD21|nr:ABC transporter C family member 9-like [Pisum sativum]